MYMTRSGNATFFSKTNIEDIRAENKQVFAIIDMSKKQIAVSMLMKGFIFKKDLMQIHFNENYVESDKFPKAVFVGDLLITQPLSATGVNKVNISGKLTIHGITREVIVPAELEMDGQQINGQAKLNIKPEDYKISIPLLVRDNIAKIVEVTIHLSCSLKT